jgi:hypothetical protein
LNDRFETLLKPLWILNNSLQSMYRSYYHSSNDIWWWKIEVYRICLLEIGIFITSTELSRRIVANLHNIKAVKNAVPLKFPEFPEEPNIADALEWARAFKQLNSGWLENYEDIRQELIHSSYYAANTLLGTEDISPFQKRLLERLLRSTVKKIEYFGFMGTESLIVDILNISPWLIRDPIQKVEALARQGYKTELRTILLNYRNSAELTGQYLSAITLRAAKFLPSDTEFYWSVILDYAVNGSTIEKLMASEVILYRNPDQSFISDTSLKSLKTTMEKSMEVPPRLKRNYLLILKKYDTAFVEKLMKITPDEQLKRLNGLLNDIELDNVFNENEPDVIRRNYYFGKQPYLSIDDVY